MFAFIPPPPPPVPPIVQGRDCFVQVEIESRTYKCLTQAEYYESKIQDYSATEEQWTFVFLLGMMIGAGIIVLLSIS